MDETGLPPDRRSAGADAGAGERTRGHHLVMAVGIGAAGLVVGLVTGGVVAVAGGFGLLAGSGTETEVNAVLVASLAATELGYGLTAVAYLVYRGPGLRAVLGWPRPGPFALALVVAFALVAAGQVLLTFVPGVGVDDLVAGSAGPVSPELVLALAVVSVVFVGPAEELLFRGAVYGTLRRGFGPLPANVIASALFVIAHLGALGVGLAGLAPLAIVAVGSLLFGYAYERAGTLVVPVAMHAAYDAALFVLVYALLP